MIASLTEAEKRGRIVVLSLVAGMIATTLLAGAFTTLSVHLRHGEALSDERSARLDAAAAFTEILTASETRAAAADLTRYALQHADGTSPNSPSALRDDDSVAIIGPDGSVRSPRIGLPAHEVFAADRPEILRLARAARSTPDPDGAVVAAVIDDHGLKLFAAMPIGPAADTPRDVLLLVRRVILPVQLTRSSAGSEDRASLGMRAAGIDLASAGSPTPETETTAVSATSLEGEPPLSIGETAGAAFLGMIVPLVAAASVAYGLGAPLQRVVVAALRLPGAETVESRLALGQGAADVIVGASDRAATAARAYGRAERAFDDLDRPVILIDPEGGVALVNHAVASLFRRPTTLGRDGRRDDLAASLRTDAAAVIAELQKAESATDGEARRLEIAGRRIRVDRIGADAGSERSCASLLVFRDETSLVAEVGTLSAGPERHRVDFLERLTITPETDHDRRRVSDDVTVISEMTREFLDDMQTAVDDFAAGKLDARLSARHPGRFGDVALSWNAAAVRFTDILDGAARSSGEIGASGRSLSERVSALSARTETHAASITRTTAAIDTMAESVRMSTKHAQEAGMLARDAARRASDGRGVVTDAVRAVSRIEQSAAKIAEIVGVIDAIAFQTNLLALNAAVEAARAGEAGKGFAVVAAEVRTLAQRSSQAAKDIAELINASGEHVAEGVRLVQSTDTALTAIVEGVAGVADTIGLISEALERQAEAVNETGDSVGKMDADLQEGATAARDAAEVARRIEDELRWLEERLSGFGGRPSSVIDPRASARRKPTGMRAPMEIGHAMETSRRFPADRAARGAGAKPATITPANTLPADASVAPGGGSAKRKPPARTQAGERSMKETRKIEAPAHAKAASATSKARKPGASAARAASADEQDWSEF